MAVAIFIFVFFNKDTNKNYCENTISVIKSIATIQRDTITCHYGSVPEIIAIDNLVILKCNCSKNPDAGTD